MSDTTKKDEIKIRREYVKRLYIRKLTIPEIAKRLEVTEKTIDRDLQVIKQENNHNLQKKLEKNGSLQNMVEEYVLAKDEITRELWSNYHLKGASIRDKVQSLKALSSVYEEKMSMLQGLGLVERVSLSFKDETEDKISNPEKQKLADDFTEFIKKKYQYPLEN